MPLPLERDILGRILSVFGYEVIKTKDGLEAIKKYQEAIQAGKPFDVVIIDLIILGYMDGDEVL